MNTDSAQIAAKNRSKTTATSSSRRRSNESDPKCSQSELREQHETANVNEAVDGSFGDETPADSSESDNNTNVVRVQDPQTPATDQSAGGRNDIVSTAAKWRRILERERSSSSSSDEVPPLVPDAVIQKRRKRMNHSRTIAEPTRVRSSKKRRYVGGYFHSGDDADATFIQPEDDANALPDDVARDIGLRLGKSKAELKAQLATVAGTLTANLRAFEDEKDLITQKSKRASSLPVNELQDFYRQVRREARGELEGTVLKGVEWLVHAHLCMSPPHSFLHRQRCWRTSSPRS